MTYLLPRKRRHKSKLIIHNSSITLYPLTFLCLLTIACGVQAPPQVPRVEKPAKITDLSITQRGPVFELTFTSPEVTADGERLTKPLEIEIFRAISKPGETPPENLGGSVPWLALSPKEVVQQTTEDKFVYAARLQDQEFAQSVGKTFSFGVLGLTRGFRNRPLPGDLSNIVRTQLLDVSGPVEDLHIKTTEKALELTWTPPSRGLSGTSLAPLAGYRVYWSPTGKPESFVLRGEPPTPAFADLEFAFEHDSYYRVRAIFKQGNQIAESEDSPVAQVLPHDTFPPTPPTKVSALFSAGAVQLVWSANTEPDLAGYNVYRRESGGTPQKINADLLRTPTFEDRSALPGHQYFYRVTALDLTQNESAASAEAAVETR